MLENCDSHCRNRRQRNWQSSSPWLSLGINTCAGSVSRLSIPSRTAVSRRPRRAWAWSCIRYRGPKHLRKDHRIWLRVMDDKTCKTWPPGLVPVEYSNDQGTWKGYIHAWGWNNVAIVAVVAPPTSQDYFNYFRAWDPKRTTSRYSVFPSSAGIGIRCWPRFRRL
jgi:hypothetical protein